MKKIITISILLLLVKVNVGQYNWVKIYDSPYYGIMNFYTEKINISNQKTIYLMLGLNYINPNESGRILRFNKNNGNWVIPSNGFLNPYWCLGAIPPNPAIYHCNFVRHFRVSPSDTQFIMKNSEIYCGGYDGGNSFFVTYNSGADTSFIPGFSNDFLGQLCTGFDVNPVNDSIIYVLYPIIGYSTPVPIKVYKSTNRGSNWFITDSIDVQATEFSFFKINPLRPGFVYASGSSQKMSTNSGYNFFQMNVPLLKGMYFDTEDSSIYGLSLYDSAMYRSTNHGLNWSLLYKFNERPTAFEISPDNHNILYAGTPSGLYRSINKGLTWSLYNNSYYPSKNVIGISKDPGTGETLYVSTTDAVYKVWGPNIVNIDTNSLQFFPLAVGNVWVYSYSQWGQPQAFCGICTERIRIVITNTTVIEGKTFYQGNISVIHTSGACFGTDFNLPDFSSYIRVDSLTGEVLQFSANGGCTYRPNEILLDSLKMHLYDSIWYNCQPPVQWYSYVCLDTSNTIIFGQNRQCRRYGIEGFEGGNSRTYVKGIGITASNSYRVFCTHNTQLLGCVINGILYGDTTLYYTISGQVLYSDNNQPVQSGYVKALKYDWVLDKIITIDSARINYNGYYSLTKCPQDSLDIMAYGDDEFQDFVPTYYDTTIYWQNAITLYPTGNINNVNIKVQRIIRTANNNNYFVSGGVFRAMLIPIDALKDAMVYAKFNDQFVSFGSSIANGYYIVDSLPAGKCDVIVDRMGYYSDYRSLLVGEYVLDTINFFLTRVVGITKQVSSLPTSFMLFQNYPNPFNPLTTIQFNIPPMHNNPPARPGGKGVFTKLVVYDILGRETVTLVNEELSAGSYTVVWDASNYASGLYFYKLITDEFTETKKMVLIK